MEVEVDKIEIKVHNVTEKRNMYVFVHIHTLVYLKIKIDKICSQRPTPHTSQPAFTQLKRQNKHRYKENGKTMLERKAQEPVKGFMNGFKKKRLKKES